MNKKIEFGDELKAQRTLQHKTQTDCARACNVCLETYQKWERGVSFPKPVPCGMICEYLGVDEKWKDENMKG